MAEAARWYERNRAGLGSEFLTAVDATLDRIRENPRVGLRVPGVDVQDIRRLFVRRFPFQIVYIEMTNRLQILAIAHDRRRPAYWVGRLPR